MSIGPLVLNTWFKDLFFEKQRFRSEEGKKVKLVIKSFFIYR